jgi:hypothetical protein
VAEGLAFVAALGLVAPPCGESEYVVAGEARVVRRSRGVETELRCLEGRETGAIAALARHPHGTVWVAAERGLFVAADGCDVLDRVDLEGGEPPGTPVGVACADPERVWLLTSEALCAVETRQLFWSVVESEGLPPPPYSALDVKRDGALEIVHAAGRDRFEPGRSSRAPQEPRLRIAGREIRGGDVIELAYGEPLRLEIAPGRGERWMWRDAARFRWKPFDVNVRETGEAEIPMVRPGRHSLRAVAFDSQLRRSAPLAIEVDVAYPDSLDPRRLAAGALLGLSLAAGLTLRSALRRRRSWREAWKALLSVALAACVALQLAAAAFPHAKGWPFIGFTMYTSVSRRDDVAYRHELSGVRPDGSRRPLAPPGAKFGKFETERALQPFLHDEDGVRERFLAEWNAAHPEDPLAGLVDLCRRRRMRPEGAVEVPPIVMLVHPVELRDVVR